jgi:hypothetical protein
MVYPRFLVGAPAALLAAGLWLHPAQAASNDHHGKPHTAETGSALATAQVDAATAATAVKAAGYGAIREIAWEHGRWEVKASAADGRPARLHVDAVTGAVTARGH